jgi:tagatose-1,6-bisphosphate aldolase
LLHTVNSGNINVSQQAPEHLKRYLSDVSNTLSSYASHVLKELAVAVKTMKKSSKIDYSIGKMQHAVKELQKV